MPFLLVQVSLRMYMLSICSGFLLVQLYVGIGDSEICYFVVHLISQRCAVTEHLS